MAEALDTLRDHDREFTEVEAPVERLRFDTGDLVVGGEQFALADSAVAQLAARARAPAGYLTRLSPETRGLVFVVVPTARCFSRDS